MGEGGNIDTQKPFKRVGTHHGRFHADEVMATAILKELFHLEVIRTRNMEILKGLDLVYDVGGGEFDHHDLDKEYRDNGTPYAACGLIWRRFGRDVIRAWESSIEPRQIESIFFAIDTTLIEGIDAVDNGLKTGDTIIPTMSISSIISSFNPPWDSNRSEIEAFEKAVDFASSVLRNALSQRLAVVRARENVIEAFSHRFRPEVMVMDVVCPWGQILKEIDREEDVQFVIYPSRDGYTLQTVRKRGRGLQARKDLPKAWAGKRDEELGEIIGIDDAIFCHPGRFIAGARSYDSIIKMADIAVAEPPEGLKERLRWYWRRLFHRKG